MRRAHRGLGALRQPDGGAHFLGDRRRDVFAALLVFGDDPFEQLDARLAARRGEGLAPGVSAGSRAIRMVRMQGRRLATFRVKAVTSSKITISSGLNGQGISMFVPPAFAEEWTAVGEGEQARHS